MSGDEVIGRLSEQARVNIADFVTVTLVPASIIPLSQKENGDDDSAEDAGNNAQGSQMIQIVELNWDAIRERGHLIKSITNTRHGPKIELHDGQSALVNVGRHHKLFIDQQQVSGTIQHTGDKAEHERYDRAISTLAEALREIIPGAGAKPEGVVGPAE